MKWFSTNLTFIRGYFIGVSSLFSYVLPLGALPWEVAGHKACISLNMVIVDNKAVV